MNAPLWWVVFGLLHSLLAQNGVRIGLKSSQSSRFNQIWRLAYNGLALGISWKAVKVGIEEAGKIPEWTGSITQYFGVGLLLAGIGIAVIGFRGYRLFEFLGIKQAKSTSPLITTGLQGIVRHPLYSGTLLMFVGTAVLWPVESHWYSLLVLTIYTLVGIEFEERDLMRIHGNHYKEYRHQVKWKVIPLLW